MSVHFVLNFPGYHSFHATFSSVGKEDTFMNTVGEEKTRRNKFGRKEFPTVYMNASPSLTKLNVT
jgi:hypothetical protein